MALPADRQIVTRRGLLDVAVQLREDGRCVARLAGDYPEFAHLGAAFGDTKDEAVARLAEMVEQATGPSSGAVVVGLDALLADQASLSYREFLRVPALSLGLFAVGPGHGDRQSPHGVDEVYVIIAGRAVVDVGGVRTPVESGSVAYVPAGVPHHFEDVTGDLRVIVMFSPPNG